MSRKLRSFRTRMQGRYPVILGHTTEMQQCISFWTPVRQRSMFKIFMLS